MAKYIEYGDYDALFPGRLTEAQFEHYLPGAEAHIDRLTHHRAEQAEGCKAERVKQAVCAVVREMAAWDARRNEAGAKLVSVSNDGYTEYYGETVSEETESAAINRTVRMWLSGTGLVSAL